MRYTEIETSNGPYLIDYAMIQDTLEQCCYIIALNNSAVTKKMPGGGPDVYSVEVNWDAASHARKTGPNTFLSRYRIPNQLLGLLTQSSFDVDPNEIEHLRNDLYEFEKKAITASRALKDKRNQASDRGMANIRKSVEFAEKGIAVSTFIRDVSVDGLLLGGTILTGGAASGLAAVAGGTAILKGGAKYQDTGNIGAAVLTANFEFITALVPGKAASKFGTYALVFTKKMMSFQGDVAVGLVEGKSLTDSATGAAVKVGVGTALGPLKSKTLDDMQTKLIAGDVLKNQIVPVTVNVMTGNSLQDKAIGMASDAATAEIIKAMNANGKKPNTPLKKVTTAIPLRVDYAIVGPYRSTEPRKFIVERAA